MSGLSFIWKVVVVIGLILILGTSTGLVIQSFGRAKERKLKEVALLERDECRTAPSTEVIIHDSVFIYDTIFIKSKPIYHEPATPPTESQVAKACSAKYSIPVRFTKEGETWRFLATYTIKDCWLEDMEISNAVLPKRISIQTKQIDTCIAKLPQYRPVNHWLLQGSVIGNSLSKMPNADLMVGYSIKDYFIISLGGEYNTYHNELYAKLSFGIYLDPVRRRLTRQGK